MRVHHLNCGTIRGATVRGHHLVCHVLLVETDRSGLLLVDTGLGTADCARSVERLGRDFVHLVGRPTLDPELTATAQLQRLGFVPQDVRHVVVTHLDLDHVGGLADFPWAEVHVHRPELDAATARRALRERARYRPTLWEHGVRWAAYDVSGEPWCGFPAVRQLRGIDEEVALVSLPGHTRGHAGVAVHDGRGWLLAAGDAYFDGRQVRETPATCSRTLAAFQRAVAMREGSRRRTLDGLRELHARDSDVRLFSAHDPFEYLDLVAAAGQEPRGVSTNGGAGGTGREWS